MADEELRHGMNCGAYPGSDEFCTCGLEYRIALRAGHAAWRKRAEDAEALLARALETFKLADKERLQAVHDANDEAEKWKSEGDMYGWNFHVGKAGGMTEASIIFYRVRRLLETIGPK